MLHQLLVRLKQPFLKLVPVPTPECWQGAGEVKRLTEALHRFECHKPLIVTDKALSQLGIASKVTDALEATGVSFAFYDQVEPDPGFDTVNAGVNLYREHDCDSLIALGGGSVMDCGKAILACIKTNKPISKLPGLMTVRKKIAPLIAIPTTAGTGSEATIAAVVTDKVAKQKLAITDPVLVPKLAILDAELMTGLPPHITAATGVDALTHAIESYLSLYADNFTKLQSIEAIDAIFKHLPTAYKQGNNLAARSAMAKASYQGGIAFTRTYIGYVHAIAHQLGGIYQIPHGLANAMLLVKVLEFSLSKSEQKLAELAINCHLVSPETNSQTAACAFIQKVKQLLEEIEIPTHIAQLTENDIPTIAQRAIKEAYGIYPVPREMNRQECEQLLHGLLPV